MPCSGGWPRSPGRSSRAEASAYRYLPDSLDAFPSPEQLAATMRAAGLTDVSYRRLTTGVVALHRGRVPQGS